MNDENDDLLERLASLEHEQWMRWSKDIYNDIKNMFVDARQLQKLYNRWAPLWIPYPKLSDRDKEQDRKWARIMIEMLRRAEALRIEHNEINSMGYSIYGTNKNGR